MIVALVLLNYVYHMFDFTPEEKQKNLVNSLFSGFEFKESGFLAECSKQGSSTKRCNCLKSFLIEEGFFKKNHLEQQQYLKEVFIPKKNLCPN